LAEGVRAGQSTPLVSRNGNTVGMISTYWRKKHVPTEREFRLLDILARQAADLSERSRSNEILQRSERQLKEADARKEQFLATLAHELRNPLAPIRNAVAFLNLAKPLNPDFQWARDVILQQTVHLSRLVDDLLDVSRINLGRLDLHKQRLDLVRLLESVMETNRFLLEEHGTHLIVTMPSEPVIVDADPTRLAQVFSNVLNNAAKFSNPGTTIAVVVEVQAHHVTVSVRDHGIGISAADLPHVFDLFAQFHRSFERDRGGLGIGLALAKRMAEMHGGRMMASSDGLGRGSEFTIELPIASADGKSTKAGQQVANPVSAPLRVLVIDDHEAAAMTMSRLLRALGHEARHATNAIDGMSAAAEFRPDAILLDIGMPKINGYELARRIRAEMWGGDILLIAVTGWGQSSDKQRAADAGFDHHLTKPVDAADVTALLSSRRPVI
jgi:signal transduction histidine kinase/CheY-like chemotaxis protein